ncbi:unnamed protein product [Leptidea sinapis]|uniref:Uncharacterized protein n=1 Tax=Leptidea sinapis TaxID=189913 RepID=A0A5E4QFZ9_9NEOP|nr:unnamed protein product [Leptidea sinapis]
MKTISPPVATVRKGLLQEIQKYNEERDLSKKNRLLILRKGGDIRILKPVKQKRRKVLPKCCAKCHDWYPTLCQKPAVGDWHCPSCQRKLNEVAATGAAQQPMKQTK